MFLSHRFVVGNEGMENEKDGTMLAVHTGYSRDPFLHFLLQFLSPLDQEVVDIFQFFHASGRSSWMTLALA